MKIARVEEQIKAQDKRFDRVDAKLDLLFKEMDALKAAMNRGRGVFAASLTFAGLIGGLIGTALQWFTPRH